MLGILNKWYRIESKYKMQKDVFSSAIPTVPYVSMEESDSEVAATSRRSLVSRTEHLPFMILDGYGLKNG